LVKDAQEEYNLNRDYKEKAPLDIISIEKCLYYFDKINKHLDELEFFEARRKRGISEIFKNKPADMELSFLKPDMQKDNFSDLTDKMGRSTMIRHLNSKELREKEAWRQKREKYDLHKDNFDKESMETQEHIEGKLKELVKELVSKIKALELSFVPNEKDYSDEEKFLLLPKARFFKSTVERNYEYDLLDDQWRVNLNLEEPTVLDRYGELLTFMDKTQMDKRQQEWLNKAPLWVHYLRPVQKEDNLLQVEKDHSETRQKEVEKLVNKMIFYKTIDL
jgi:hypothetical protein